MDAETLQLARTNATQVVVALSASKAALPQYVTDAEKELYNKAIKVLNLQFDEAISRAA